MEPWRSGITTSDETSIFIRGYDVTSLMVKKSFTDVIYLLYQGRLPTEEERRMLDAVLIGVSDHGPSAPSAAAARIVASGNRQSLEAAIAAGVLAMGDVHGGAAYECVQMIGEGIESAGRDPISVREAAFRRAADAKSRHARLPGLGHRVHTRDPRTHILFSMARESGFAGDGIKFMEALEEAAREQFRPLPINIDGALSAVLFDMGFPPEAAKLVFIIGRIAGVAAHVMEERMREKPMRVHIPVVYDGPPPRGMDQVPDADAIGNKGE
jgi:citrate synthase